MNRAGSRVVAPCKVMHVGNKQIGSPDCGDEPECQHVGYTDPPEVLFRLSEPHEEVEKRGRDEDDPAIADASQELSKLEVSNGEEDRPTTLPPTSAQTGKCEDPIGRSTRIAEIDKPAQ